MNRYIRGGLQAAMLLVILGGCAAPTSSITSGSQSTAGPAAPASAQPKRIVVSITGDLPVLRSQFNRAAGGIQPGALELESLLNAGLTVDDDKAVLQPQLAEAVPSIDNGLWKVNSDGTMETTWRLRDGDAWQDGAPYTSDDLVFSTGVIQDPELPDFRYVAFNDVTSVSAPDPQTFVIEWSQPYIDADKMFGEAGPLPALPLPRHILEQQYTDNKAGFMDLPYWSDQFVGAGAYKVRDWVRGSSLVMIANDSYVLGRPKIDEIDVRFNPDPTTLVAALLSGDVDQPLGRGVSFDQGITLQQQWQAGKVTFAPSAGIKVWPELLNPNPPIVGDVRFRRAMYMAIDRQQLVDTLEQGQAQVANSIVTPTDPEYPFVVDSMVTYPYDPNQTAQILQDLGYVKGNDGSYQDAQGQPLTVEFRGSQEDILRKMKLAIASDWEAAGIGVNVVDDSNAQRGDNQYRATFPAFDISRASSGTEAFSTFLSSEARTAASHYAGQNSSNLMSPEYDALTNQYLTTIPWNDRMAVAAQVVHYMTDQVVVLDQFYDATPTAVSNRIVNASPRPARNGIATWDVQQWDVQ